MKYRKLGKNGKEVSTVGFGAWGISGLDWGVTDDAQSKRAIHKALDSGVNFIDTADTYGFGHSETLIASVLKERKDRNNIIIATKAGNNFYPFIEKGAKTTPSNADYSKDYLISALEKSLKRLGVEAVDVFQLHSPSIQFLEMDEPWMALEQLKKQGKILQTGWSIQSFQETQQAHILDQHADLIDTIQVRYNLLEREAEQILFPKALQYGIGVIARIPILFGLLAGKFSADATFPENDHRHIHLAPEKLKVYFKQFERLKSFYDAYPDYSFAELSLRFCISHPAVHTVIPGAKTERQVEENVRASELEHILFSDFPFNLLNNDNQNI